MPNGQLSFQPSGSASGLTTLWLTMVNTSIVPSAALLQRFRSDLDEVDKTMEAGAAKCVGAVAVSRAVYYRVQASASATS